MRKRINVFISLFKYSLEITNKSLLLRESSIIFTPSHFSQPTSPVSISPYPSPTILSAIILLKTSTFGIPALMLLAKIFILSAKLSGKLMELSKADLYMSHLIKLVYIQVRDIVKMLKQGSGK